MKKLISASLCASIIGAAALLGMPLQLHAQWGTITQSSPPPPPLQERTPRPRRGYVWEPGHWEVDQRSNRYVWIDGQWLQERPGYAYREPQWRERDGRWEYQSGRWDRDRDGIPDRRDRRIDAPRSPAVAQRAQPPANPPVPPELSRCSDWVPMRDGDTGAATWFNQRTRQYSGVDPTTACNR
jgi:hypothetical protein